MGATAINALARLSERRFQSFSEAADAVLALLETELPADAILLGQLDWDEGQFRIMDARGQAAEVVRPGSAIALASSDNGSSNGLLDPEALRSLAVRSYLAIPFETSDGSGAVTLCALGGGTNVFTGAHLDLLGVAGRLLTYEWESVRWRAQIRRMAEQLRDPDRTDSVTGLPNADAFAAEVEREWALAQRGTIESYVVVLRVTDFAAVGERVGEAMSQLLLKDMAEVLGGAIRRTDHMGRTGEDEMAAVLVGCKGRAGAEAFSKRFREAFVRVTTARPATLAISGGACDLGAAASSDEALEAARAEALSAPAGSREER